MVSAFREPRIEIKREAAPTVTVTSAPVPAPTVTVTKTPKPRPTKTIYVTPPASRSVPRLPKPRSERRLVSFDVWLSLATARKVLHRESGGRCDAVNPSGKYRGRWQMDSTFWKTYGGLAFATTPDRATCHEQDLVAYKGWIYRGWAPWTTA
jgi:hypothetical protein